MNNEVKEAIANELNSVKKASFDFDHHKLRIERAIVALQGAQATMEWAQEEISIEADKIAEHTDQSVDEFLSTSWPQIFKKDVSNEG